MRYVREFASKSKNFAEIAFFTIYCASTGKLVYENHIYRCTQQYVYTYSYRPLSISPVFHHGEKKSMHPADGSHGDHFTTCARICAECQINCEDCYRHCTERAAAGGMEHAAAMHLCLDCADACATASRLAARNGPLSALACEACAKACDACAEACEAAGADRHMSACAQSCRDCANSCREMTASGTR